MSRFDYVKYDEQAAKEQAKAKELCEKMEGFINTNLKDSHAKEIALTRLQETYMWIGIAIRNEQVTHRGAELQEVRG